MKKRMQLRGPLAPHASGFRTYLEAAGYSTATTDTNIRVLASVSRWLQSQGLGADGLSPKRLDAFVDARRRSRSKDRPALRSLRPLLRYLGSIGIEALPDERTPLEALLDEYRCYLVGERGLALSTVEGYMKTATRFLAECCAGEREKVAGLSAADTLAFIVRESSRLRPKTVNEVVVGLRSLLRFLYVKGMIAAPLAQATPWMARARASSLPRTLDAGVAARLLASCDRTTVVGARDFAIVTVVTRLGLRASEVAGLTLDDIDWRSGLLVVRGKAESCAQLPLPVDVGKAVSDYLEHRAGDPTCRQVFLQVKPPRGGVQMTDVRAVVRRACSRAGIGDTGTHRFRHAAATEMLRLGAPLHEIGQVLRHRDLETTAIYAKVDFESLAAVAQPWPGVQA
jgi:integrase/recombinase XerD